MPTPKPVRAVRFAHPALVPAQTITHSNRYRRAGDIGSNLKHQRAKVKRNLDDRRDYPQQYLPAKPAAQRPQTTSPQRTARQRNRRNPS